LLRLKFQLSKFEYRQVRYLISTLLVAGALTGCSSTPEFVPVEARMDCVYSSDTTTHNGDLDVKKRSKCSTNPLELYATEKPTIRCMFNPVDQYNPISGETRRVYHKRCATAQDPGNFILVDVVTSY